MASLASGGYRLVGAIQGSRPATWYRQLLHARQPHHADGHPNLSCDCPAWCANQAGNRTCKHTELTAQLIVGHALLQVRPIDGPAVQSPIIVAMQPLLQGLAPTWTITEALTPIRDVTYRVTLVEHGDSADAPSAFVATNRQHAQTLQDISAATAAWAGWAIAAEVARRNGWNDLGAPPSHHYRFGQGRSASTRTTAARGGTSAPRVGVFDLLQIGQREDLGDGLRPADRAEACLRMFLGPRYDQLARQGFLDVASRDYPQRVYRVRIDPERRVDRRVRVFEGGRYSQDFCIVRQDRMQPVADGWLTVFLGLLADESRVLRVVSRHNIFDPHSDSHERETVPAVWTPRQAA